MQLIVPTFCIIIKNAETVTQNSGHKANEIGHVDRVILTPIHMTLMTDAGEAPMRASPGTSDAFLFSALIAYVLLENFSLGGKFSLQPTTENSCLLPSDASRHLEGCRSLARMKH